VLLKWCSDNLEFSMPAETGDRLNAATNVVIFVLLEI
jgi:hypothetical protein